MVANSDRTLRSSTRRQIVQILLAAGADPNIADNEGVTPLEHARAKRYDEIVAMLDPSTQDLV